MLKLALILTFLLTLSACQTGNQSGNLLLSPENSAASLAQASKYNVQLGLAYLNAGDFQAAKQKLILAQQQDPDSYIAQGAMGYFLNKTGETKQAEIFYKKAISLNPTAGATQNNYATFLCQQKRYAEADAHFMLAVQAPNYLNTAQAYENAGLCALQIPNTEKAAVYLNKAVSQDPTRVLAWLELAEMSYSQKNYAEAQTYLDHYMALSNEPEAEALWLGIRIARENGDTDKAGSYSLILQNRYPNSQQTKELLKTPYVPGKKTQKVLYF
jgi:type IV pilus assembly protein PilF